MFDGRRAPILVFDVGGSHMAASVFDPESNTIGTVRDLRVLPDSGPERFFKTVESLVGITLPGPAALRGLAIAIPNPFDYEGGISHMQHKFQSLYRMDLRRELSQRLSCSPSDIHFLNDAAASLLGEMQQGATVAAKRAVGITLGTGVGSAFAVDGEIILQGRGVPSGGEIWNQPYRDGIVEDFISTLAVQRIFEQLTGKHSEVRDIAASAVQQTEARQTFERFGTELGKVLRKTCLAFAPDRIVLGGGIARAAGHFLAHAQKELGDLQTELVVSELFERAPLIGAGVSWVNRNGGADRKGDRDRATEQV
jgi:predicted NBD/HSP70 family sugar kinase